MNLNDIIKEEPGDSNELDFNNPGGKPQDGVGLKPSQRAAIKKAMGDDDQRATNILRVYGFLEKNQSIPANYAEDLKFFIDNNLGNIIRQGAAAVDKSRKTFKPDTDAPLQDPPGADNKYGQDIGQTLDDLDNKKESKFHEDKDHCPKCGAEREILKACATCGCRESVNEEITGQDRVAIKQIVPDNQKVNDIIRGMARIQQGKNPPTDTIPAINELIQNSIGIQIDLGNAQTKRGQDLVKQQAKAGGKQQPQQMQKPKADPNELDFNPQKLAASYENSADALNEGLGYAMPGEEDSERVTYSKTKKQGDSSVTVSANADSMDELHHILRLAGIDFEKSGKVDDTPDHKDHDDHEEPEMDKKDDMDKVMVVSPADASMSTDKEVLTNYLKDKLRKSIS